MDVGSDSWASRAWPGDVAKVLGSFSKRLPKDFSPGFALALETARWGGQCWCGSGVALGWEGRLTLPCVSRCRWPTAGACPRWSR